MNDKDIKKKFRPIFEKNPEKYYAVDVLKDNGFMRKICEKSGKPFWTVDSERTVCGEPEFNGGFQFFGKSPAKNQMDYIETWQKFSKLFEKWGYTPIQRYPVAARWRDDTDFVQASIYDFQPFVVSGEVKPPANPLVVPQFCLRFNDVDNVGITGAHYTGFVMIGQHAFQPPEEWNQKKYFTDIHNWLIEGLGLPKEEIVYHEDVWAGGGNFGPCMEFFSRGLELGNQVYMTNVVTPQGIKELNLKVLDMGMGHERNAWFTKGTSTSYESVFPTVCKNLFSKTGVKVDSQLMSKFLPYSSYLNIDEVDDINKVWQDIANKLSYDVKDLKNSILPLQGLFSVGEHTRSLLFAISDGCLPSNVGGGYNLRMILRRALGFIDKYNWDVYLPDVCKWHAEYLKPIFPELMDNLDIVEEVLNVEKQKYENTKQKTRSIVEAIIKKDEIREEKLIELYDSQGISPELVKGEAEKLGKKVEVPDDFYARVTERHEQAEQNHLKTHKDLGIGEVPESKGLYFDDYAHVNFDAEVIFVNGTHVVLKETYFYPTSGGQEHDMGSLRHNNVEYKVVDVLKQGPSIVHVLDKPAEFEVGSSVDCAIDLDRRTQLSQHHSATHIVNAAAKRILGKHINQAGARKTTEKAHLDITHFRAVDDTEMKQIEDEANRIVDEDLPIRLTFMGRDEAEGKYGVFIYQGGVVPGKTLRIVEIPEVDVQACGGTHVNTTKQVGTIKLQKSTKVQDGIVRLVYTAGKAAEKSGAEQGALIADAAKLLNVAEELVPKRCEELFSKWKKGKKLMGKIRDPAYVEKIKSGEVEADIELSSTETSSGDLIGETAKILRTQPEHVPKTITRFLTDLTKFQDQLKKALE